MKTPTKAIRSANVEGKLWKKNLYQFFLNYRTTPHTTTGFPPAELLFNKKIRNKLPQLVKENYNMKTDMEAVVQNNDVEAKRKMKQYADARPQAKSSKLEVGDQVLGKQSKTNKLTTRFDSHPFRVIRMKGTMITATRNGKYITRNISYFKKLDEPEKDRKRDESDSQINSEDDDDLLLSDSERETKTTRRYPQRNRVGVQRYGQNICDC